MMFSTALRTLNLFLLLSLNSLGKASANGICSQALEMQQWALTEMEALFEGNPSPALIEALEVMPPEVDLPQLDSLSFMHEQYGPKWGFLVTGIVAAANFKGSEIGEVMYVVNTLVEKLSPYNNNNGTVETVYDVWREEWVALGDRMVQAAESTDLAQQGNPMVLKQSLYFKATYYYFCSQWAYPTSLGALEAAKKSRDAFDKYLKNSPELHYTTYDIEYNNGTATATLPAWFFTPDPTATDLPLIVVTTGLDYPVGVTYSMMGPTALENGFAIVFYEGPGQGLPKRSPPYMPIPVSWGTVIEAVMDETSMQFGNMYDSSKVALMGISLGGYLNGQACSVIPEGMAAACIVTPGAASFGDIVIDGSMDVFDVLTYIKASDFPTPEYAQAFESKASIKENVFVPLLTDCDDGTNATAAATAKALVNQFIESWGSLIPSDFVYFVYDFVGCVTGECDTAPQIYEKMYSMFQAMLYQNNNNISDTKMPVLVLSGLEDTLMGGYEYTFWDGLPADIKSQSKLINYTALTGAALHVQLGGQELMRRDIFQWLGTILGIESYPFKSSTSTQGATCKQHKAKNVEKKEKKKKAKN